MSLAGEPPPIDAYLLAVRGGLAGGLNLEQALEMVPVRLRDSVRSKWQSDQVTVDPVAVLSDGGPRDWFRGWDPAQGYHWLRLREFLLLEKRRSESVIDALDDSTDRILSMLEDPRANGPSSFQIRGLVIGNVQSGKTANFSAVIAKSIDAGYRIVIVLSGLHNSLRRQTQLRLEDELGLVAAQPGRPTVGLASAGHEIIRMTGPETREDFQAGTADPSLLHGTLPILLVVKKNASVLRRLDSWLERRAPIRPPVLVIDDEADQATINTGGNRQPIAPLEDLLDLRDDDIDTSPQEAADETDPSVINGLIRGLLGRMERAAYIGYTATPFANVLIDRDAVDREVGMDLYPADFIVSLPKPPGYVGTERLFGRAALSGDDEGVAPLDVIRRVEDHEADGLCPGRNAAVVDAIPRSLELALLDFHLAMAARDTREGATPAASMLIHGSPYTYQQLGLAEHVRNSLASIRQRWRYDLDRTRPIFQQRWEQEFVPISNAMSPSRTMTFAEIEPALARNFRYDLPVRVLNTRTDDDLDYERDPDIRAVIVGGNKLSRGLTIEGLLVSYYVRPANYFDTLLQMGRWFGYRESYVDLTRLWTTDELRERFRDLATAEEALRREIRLYDVLGKTPRDFAPRIMAHATMQITARNRMGSAQEVSADFNGSMIQTINFELRRPDWLASNLFATRAFLGSLGTPNAGDAKAGAVWSGVDWRRVVDFLGDYQTHSGVSKVSSRLLREYIHEQASRYGELGRWWVAVRGRQHVDKQLLSEDLNIAGFPEIACINRARERDSEISIGTLINPVSRGSRGGDEEIGLTSEQIERARAWSSETQVSFAMALRRQRLQDEGLLLLYPISRYSTPQRGEGQPLFADPSRGETVVGLAAVFPFSDSEATVRYVVGRAGQAPS